MWPNVRDQRVFVAAVGTIVLLAWVTLWAWTASPYARFLSHETNAADGTGASYAVVLLVFAAGWTVMTVAMMLPTSLPLIAVFRSLVRQRSNRGELVALVVAGTSPCGSARARRARRRPRSPPCRRAGRLARRERVADPRIRVGDGRRLRAHRSSTAAWTSAVRRSASRWGTGTATASGGSARARVAPRRFLSRLLLVGDARAVRSRDGLDRLDARPRRRHRAAEERLVGARADHAVRRHADRRRPHLALWQAQSL